MINFMRKFLHNNVKHNFTVFFARINHMVNIKNLICLKSTLHHEKHTNVNYYLGKISSLLPQIIQTSRINRHPKKSFKSHRTHAAENHEKWAIHQEEVAAFHVVAVYWVVKVGWFGQLLPKLSSKIPITSRKLTQRKFLRQPWMTFRLLKIGKKCWHYFFNGYKKI